MSHNQIASRLNNYQKPIMLWPSRAKWIEQACKVQLAMDDKF